MVLVANPAFPADDLAGLLKVAHASSEPLAFASPGTGTSTHLAGELLQRVAGIKMLHVPYNGSAPALTDVIGGQIPTTFVPISEAVAQAANPSIRILAVSSDKSSARPFCQPPIIGAFILPDVLLAKFMLHWPAFGS